jgi:exopolysaccharide production protein ExoY
MTASLEELPEIAPGAGLGLRFPIRSSRAGLHATLKRSFDLCAACGLIVVFSPVLIVVALMIWARDGGPVVYAHERIGRGGRVFNCLKFRTMVRDSDRMLAEILASSATARAEWRTSRKLRDDPRVIGGVGRFLRQTSLDELPQLINVLRGEMSLVGPRPVVADELANYGGHLKWYLAVRPGLTGPWQVGGRSDTSYATRVALDVDYAKNPDLGRDLRIVGRTAAVLLRGKGAY